MILPTQDEHIVAKVYKRNPNSYSWEEKPSTIFKCRLASQLEKKSYRIQKGVNGSNESVFIYASNLPKEIGVDDKIEILGELKVIKSIGYYFDDSVFINAGIFPSSHIFNNSPKGLNLQ